MLLEEYYKLLKSSRIGIKEIINTTNSFPKGIDVNPSNNPTIAPTILSTTKSSSYSITSIISGITCFLRDKQPSTK